MIEAYHIASLLAVCLFCERWSTETWLDKLIKFSLIGIAAWGAVIVAKDWFV